jgi:O-6-methylguanine DNA methyltransferase
LIRALHDLSHVSAPGTLRKGVMMHTGLIDVYARLETRIGTVFVAYNAQGIAALWQAPDAAAFEAYFQGRFGRPATFTETPDQALIQAITRRLDGERIDLRFDLRGLTDFERAVLNKALDIPPGEVRPYAWIAREIERPGAVRAVGSALGHNPVPLLIPCHRVVRTDGKIGDYVFGSAHKRSLLEAEGIDTTSLEHLLGSGVRFIGSDTTRMFCYPTCRYARRISPAHRVPFVSESAAQAAGYRPCKVCRPAV